MSLEPSLATPSLYITPPAKRPKIALIQGDGSDVTVSSGLKRKQQASAYKSSDLQYDGVFCCDSTINKEATRNLQCETYFMFQLICIGSLGHSARNGDFERAEKLQLDSKLLHLWVIWDHLLALEVVKRRRKTCNISSFISSLLHSL